MRLTVARWLFLLLIIVLLCLSAIKIIKRNLRPDVIEIEIIEPVKGRKLV